jgi:hypothetical protein
MWAQKEICAAQALIASINHNTGVLILRSANVIHSRNGAANESISID